MRAICSGVAFGLLVSTLAGCGHSGFTGTLGENTGLGPQPFNGQPVVTSVSPVSVVAGGPGFTVTVTGTNFAQGDTVQWDFTSLASTFISPTQMTASVPSQLLSVSNAPTTAVLAVQPPVPDALSFGANLTIFPAPLPGTAGITVSMVAVQANDMVWDAKSGQIYLSVAGTNPTNPNTITPLDPVTGKLGTSVSAGPGANHLAVSSDGSWLFAGIDKNGSVQRFSLPSLGPDITIPLGSDSSGQPYSALDLEAAPGSPATIAVSRASSVSQAGSVAVYDGPTQRPTTSSGPTGYFGPVSSLAWNPNGSAIYGAYPQGATYPVLVLGVSSSGVQLTSSSQPLMMGAIQYSAVSGDVYGYQGNIFDPSNNTIGTRLPLVAVGGGIWSGQGTVLTVDDTLGMVWVLTTTLGAPSQQMTLETFDVRTNAVLGSVDIPNVTGMPVKLIRWGSNGLAVLTASTQASPQASPQGAGVFLLSGTFVTTPSVQLRGGGADRH